ncbi:hypothetical protein PLICRDRAFT_181189 [Plicaturopsis crispa FD-325 SS-3]|uniref:Uncharacterized protein n=1 Tax=Plicaturopsis crispa FD-325 SS-3 TaxID=944288 RepID=A0A0C9SUX4_PLICR|nr:hypothetical protein PLICRDRAFT_181189 [Plicaturopsis crispa FD-325 SS-3]
MATAAAAMTDSVSSGIAVTVCQPLYSGFRSALFVSFVLVQFTLQYNRLAARQALYSVVHDPQQPVSLYIQSLTAARAKLDALGVKIDDQEFKDVLLMRLDDSFSSLRTTILAQSHEPDLARISSLLTSSALSGSFASAVKGGQSETALYSRPSRSRAKGESARSSTAPVDAKGFCYSQPLYSGFRSALFVSVSVWLYLNIQ